MISPSDRSNSVHYTWGNNCDSWVLMESDSLSVKQESMPPASREKLHFHQQSQQYFFILNGEAAFYVTDEQIIVKEKQGLLIQPGMQHYIANETNQRLDFLVISQPSTKTDRVEL